MTVNISLSASDAGVYRSESTYSSAKAGPGESITTGTLGTFGQNYTGSAYVIDEMMIEFPYTLDSTSIIDSAFFEVTCAIQYGAGVARQLEVAEFDFGATITTADWRTPSQLDALTDLASCPGINGAGAEQKIRLSGAGLRNRLQSTGVLRTVWFTDKTRNEVAPTSDNRTTIYTRNISGTSKDPALVWTTIKQSLLSRVGGAACQLSDGTNIVLDATVAEPQLSSSTIKLRRISSAGVSTDIATLTVGLPGFGQVIGGFQSMTVCRDSADNIYVIGRAAGSSTSLAFQAFLKGAGLTWTAQTIRTVAVGTYGSSILNFAAAWHSAGGTDGTIVVAYTAAPAEPERTNAGSSTNQTALAFVNPGWVKTGSGTATRGILTAPGFMATYSSGFSWFTNETMTGLDVMAAPGSSDVGILIGYNGDDGISSHDPAITRYQINSSGNGFADTDKDEVSAGTITRDANSKLRAIAISSSVFALAAGDRPFTVVQATGSGFTTLGSVSLASLTGASGAPASLNGLTTWDLVHDAGGNRLWLYYLDKNNQRTLKRTAFDLSTMLPVNTEVTVSSSVGASGATNFAIRAPRGRIAGTQLVINVASQASGAGAHSTINIADTFNLPPNAPVLTPHANYDAASASPFLWTFSDPNPGDVPSAYELHVINTASGSTVVNTGKVVSASSSHTITGGTLAASAAYQWEVRNWDQGDASGAFSALSSFSTGAGGNVTITNPATDNPAGVIAAEYTVQWSVTGTVQAAYKVVLKRTDTGATVSDTGFVASTATEHVVTGMVSGVEHRVEVTVRNAALIVSSTSNRLITPQYGEPELPLVDLTALPDDGYIEVMISNPVPGSIDLGTVPDGFETLGASASYSTTNAVLTTGDTTQFASGSASAKLVLSASGAQGYFRQTPAFMVDIIPGQRYTALFDLFAPVAASAGFGAAIDWYSASAVYMATASNAAGAASGVWHTREVTGTAPAGAASAAFGPTIGVEIATTGRTIFVDNLILVAANDRPEPTGNELYRREVGIEDEYTLIAELEPDETYQDHTVRPGRVYEYMVRAIASSGIADSDPDQAVLDLAGTGVWLLDPSDPDGTSANYRYGEGRADDLDTMGEGAHYTGREAPVFDYGEHVTASVAVTVQVPFGDVWRAQLDELEEFARLKRTVLYRDGRGRKVYGQMIGFTRNDERWGTMVGFTIEATDYTEAVA